MARFPEEEIQRLKREISVADLARARGVVLTKSGEDFIGLCPFHDDREPSMIITPSNNLWHCFGACQAGGSVIDFVMRAERASFRHAVEMLQGGADLSVKPGQAAVAAHNNMRRKLEPLTGGDAADGELMARVVGHYHAALAKNVEALAYLQERGLENPELIERFRVGICDRTLGYRLPPGGLKLPATLRGRLCRLGVLRETGHEHFRGCVVVPLLDASGNVVQIYGRRLDDTKSPRHLYLAAPQRGVFNLEGLVGAEEVILCEAILDAMTFWLHGYRNVTTGYGIEGVTEEILEAIVTSGAKVVKIAFDRDEAGDRGAEKVAERLAARGLEAHRVVFPRGMDANEYARKVEPAKVSLGLVLRQAEWMRGSRVPAAVHEEPLESLDKVEANAEESPTEIPFLAASASPPSSFAPSEPPPASSRSMTEETSTQEQEGAGPCSLETVLGLAEPGPTPPEVAPAEGVEPAVEGRLEVELEVIGEDRFVSFGSRRWRIRAAGKSSSSELRVNLLVSDEREGGRFFVDTVDLYSARQRTHFASHAAEELAAEERELRRDVGALIMASEKDRRTEKAAAATAEKVEMTADDKREALAFLRDPQLLDRLLEDMARAGMVGEETNKLVCYLAATSRKLEEPLAIVIQSASAAGKSSLMDSVLALMPEEERVQYSAMTGQSLFYMGGQQLKHKILAIAEEEGAERASYALKILQSEGELTIASAGKDPGTGKHITHEYRVEGPVMIMLTTTAYDVDEELLNRCVVLTVDEGREQTEAIHVRQRSVRTLQGQMGSEEKRQIRRLHRNVQRLLRPIPIVNPYAMELQFPSHTTRTRRDHMKYLTLISSVALLHQHQRPVKTVQHRGRTLEYIEATRRDIEVATELTHHILGRSLDELPPQARTLLGVVEDLVTERTIDQGVDKQYVRFTRRELRARAMWGDTQLKLHLRRLEELEYVTAHRRGPNVQYELRYGGEGKDGRRFVIGLEYDFDRSAENAHRSAEKGDRSDRNRAWSVGGRFMKSTTNLNDHQAIDPIENLTPEITTAVTGNSKVS